MWDAAQSDTHAGFAPAYIVSAYKRPDLLHRLVHKLNDAQVAVHLDRKVDASQFGYLGPQVEMLPRHPCNWGDFGHVAASLEGLRWFVGTTASHAILLTGQCYPLTGERGVRAKLAELGDRSQMRLLPVPRAEWGPSGGMNRIERHYFSFQGKLRSLTRLNARIPGGLQPYGGGGYWCMSRRDAEYVLDYVARAPEVVRFFRTALIPDEMFFHTILANSPHGEDIVREPFNFVRWRPRSPHPEILGDADLDDAMASGLAIARKFEDHAVLDRLDERIARAVRQDSHGRLSPAATLVRAAQIAADQATAGGADGDPPARTARPDRTDPAGSDLGPPA
jgi:hypothetical protein